MPGMRIEKDTFGPIEVPDDHLWGAQTQRSLEHFRISGERMPAEIVQALAWVKRACATVNHSLGGLTAEKAGAISQAAACARRLPGPVTKSSSRRAGRPGAPPAETALGTKIPCIRRGG